MVVATEEQILGSDLADSTVHGTGFGHNDIQLGFKVSLSYRDVNKYSLAKRISLDDSSQPAAKKWPNHP